MSDETRYFNFPICLIEGFLLNSKKCLTNIYDYSTYKKCLEYYESEEFDWTINVEIERVVSLSDSFFGISTVSKEASYMNGKELYESIAPNFPKASISIEIFFSYYKGKTYKNLKEEEIDKATLLAFLAFRSIIGTDKVKYADNDYLDGRLAGLRGSLPEFHKTVDNIDSFFTRRKRTRLIKNLELDWGLKYYSYRLYGFYFSFTMPLEDLIFIAEKKRRANKEKVLNAEKNEARKRVLKKLSDSEKHP